MDVYFYTCILVKINIIYKIKSNMHVKLINYKENKIFHNKITIFLGDEVHITIRPDAIKFVALIEYATI